MEAVKQGKTKRVTECQHDSRDLLAIAAIVRTQDSWHWQEHRDSIHPKARYLGGGSFKHCLDLLCGKHVLKVMRYEQDGQDKEPDEVKVLREVRSTKRLAPVVAYFEHAGAYVAAKCDPWPTSKGECDWMEIENSTTFERLSKWARLQNIGDVHSGNVGMLNGKHVILDYDL